MDNMGSAAMKKHPREVPLELFPNDLVHGGVVGDDCAGMEKVVLEHHSLQVSRDECDVVTN
ncbi:hypothetical protein PF010_g19301 [Phytophthora fragariae]|uniref:Uncharacterized protein n=1 Tax=Phytophthora fragariae TaxID=53985 RepID=A0A6A3D6R5_9STRA|nr:hypothetical protein PF009_g32982 [Phytophthora fragariae]KAE9088651.1 hypothetical protein PF010_g19301 [Phytophthora fragariae]